MENDVVAGRASLRQMLTVSDPSLRRLAVRSPLQDRSRQTQHSQQTSVPKPEMKQEQRLELELPSGKVRSSARARKSVRALPSGTGRVSERELKFGNDADGWIQTRLGCIEWRFRNRRKNEIPRFSF
jgi:hypothetical protein